MGVSQGLPFAVDRAKQNILDMGRDALHSLCACSLPLAALVLRFSRPLMISEEIDRPKTAQSACFAGWVPNRFYDAPQMRVTINNLVVQRCRSRPVVLCHQIVPSLSLLFEPSNVRDIYRAGNQTQTMRDVTLMTLPVNTLIKGKPHQVFNLSPVINLPKE